MNHFIHQDFLCHHCSAKSRADMAVMDAERILNITNRILNRHNQRTRINYNRQYFNSHISSHCSYGSCNNLSIKEHELHQVESTLEEVFKDLLSVLNDKPTSYQIDTSMRLYSGHYPVAAKEVHQIIKSINK